MGLTWHPSHETSKSPNRPCCPEVASGKDVLPLLQTYLQEHCGPLLGEPDCLSAAWFRHEGSAIKSITAAAAEAGESDIKSNASSPGQTLWSSSPPLPVSESRPSEGQSAKGTRMSNVHPHQHERDLVITRAIDNSQGQKTAEGRIPSGTDRDNLTVLIKITKKPLPTWTKQWALVFQMSKD